MRVLTAPGAVGADRELVGKLGRRFLVWYGHVESAPAAREELQHLGAKVRRGDVIQAVDQGLLGLFRKEPVDERRPAVIDRMTDHSVLIRAVHGQGKFKQEDG